MNPPLQRNGMNGSGMPPPRTVGRDRTVGKTVTIRKGPYKGLLGIVKDTTDDIARVELHSVSKVVPVEKENLTIKDPITGQPIDLRQFGRGAGRGGPRTPQGTSAAPPRAQSAWQGGRTPIAANDSSRTPAWRASSSRTPAWNAAASGARTPAWKTDGSRTVNAYDAGYKSTLGSRTPAWAAGSKTPHHASSGFGGSSSSSGFDAFLAGARTPAHTGALGGSRTPAWGHSSGSSGKAFDAPTPGGDYAAPSPAAFGTAPTPGATGPTPRPWNDAAPTPGATSAPTPGASGYPSTSTSAGGMGLPATPGALDDGGPRYEEGTPSP
ncbi:transcription elongation factor spt5 [Coccidioides immitis RMSCC 3703]|uniref:Transcription elongation factor spt5 n=1 Tax=Coccidioides immitis RMSCC 3703 TaxID=454286 RepID=A0A0J8QPN9_COCIT|nr:transcription elongation factor spt5 [Coccidioides immitis RMSCC 3703]